MNIHSNLSLCAALATLCCLLPACVHARHGRTLRQGKMSRLVTTKAAFTWFNGPRHPPPPISWKSHININEEKYKLQEKLFWNHAKHRQWSDIGQFYLSIFKEIWIQSLFLSQNSETFVHLECKHQNQLWQWEFSPCVICDYFCNCICICIFFSHEYLLPFHLTAFSNINWLLLNGDHLKGVSPRKGSPRVGIEEPLLDDGGRAGVLERPRPTLPKLPPKQSFKRKNTNHIF